MEAGRRPQRPDQAQARYTLVTLEPDQPDGGFFGPCGPVSLLRNFFINGCRGYSPPCFPDDHRVSRYPSPGTKFSRPHRGMEPPWGAANLWVVRAECQTVAGYETLHLAEKIRCLGEYTPRRRRHNDPATLFGVRVLTVL